MSKNNFAVEKNIQPTLSEKKNLWFQSWYIRYYSFRFLKEGDEVFPTGADGKMLFSDDDYIGTWKAMEAVYKKGLVKSIGISNFNKEQIERLLQTAEVVPVTNQVRFDIFGLSVIIHLLFVF